MQTSAMGSVWEVCAFWNGSVMEVLHVPDNPSAMELSRRLQAQGLRTSVMPVEVEGFSERVGRVVDVLLWQCATGVLAMWTMLGALSQVVPEDVDDADLKLSNNRLVAHILTPHARLPPKHNAPAVAGPNGKAGRSHAVKAVAKAARPKSRDETVKQVRAMGALIVLLGRGSVDRVFGQPGLGDAVNIALGNLTNGNVGDASGNNGMGSRGHGPGGGGDVIGLGELGGRPGGAPGGADVDLGGHKTATVGTRCENCEVEGGLGKEEVARVIRRHLAQIRYCYEKQLQQSPNLSGKLAVDFTIGPQGRVTVVGKDESSLDSAPVENCVMGVVQRMVFPLPKGGGEVRVTYPFVFQAAGN